VHVHVVVLGCEEQRERETPFDRRAVRELSVFIRRAGREEEDHGRTERVGRSDVDMRGDDR
jgi:hypothetical protein